MIARAEIGIKLNHLRVIICLPSMKTVFPSLPAHRAGLPHESPMPASRLAAAISLKAFPYGRTSYPGRQDLFRTTPSHRTPCGRYGEIVTDLCRSREHSLGPDLPDYSHRARSSRRGQAQDAAEGAEFLSSRGLPRSPEEWQGPPNSGARRAGGEICSHGVLMRQRNSVPRTA